MRLFLTQIAQFESAKLDFFDFAEAKLVLLLLLQNSQQKVALFQERHEKKWEKLIFRTLRIFGTFRNQELRILRLFRRSVLQL